VVPNRFALLPPVLNHHLGLLQHKGHFPIQHLIAQLSIETLIVPALRRAGHCDLWTGRGLGGKSYYKNIANLVPKG